MLLTAVFWGVIAGVCAALVGFVVNLLSESVSPTSHLRHPGILLALFAVGLVGGVFASLVVSERNDETLSTQQLANSPTPSASKSDSITPSQFETPTQPPSPTSSPSPPADQTYSLADVAYTQVEKEGRPGNCTGGCTGFNGDAARIGGNVFPNSWLMQLDGDGRRSTTTWNTVGACTRLDTSVGLTDDSPATQVTFTITTDEGKEARETAEIGDAVPLRLDLVGARTVTIAAYVSGTEVDRPSVAWGDLRVTCSAGSIKTYYD